MTDLVVCSKKFLSEKAVDAVELSTRQKPLQKIIQCEAEQNFYLMDSVPQHWRLVPVVLSFLLFVPILSLPKVQSLLAHPLQVFL